MNNTKLIKVLKSFSRDEINEFDKFIRSPLFGVKNFVVKFYKEIKKHYPEFSEKDFNKEKIFKKLYKDKEYNDGLIRRMLSDLYKMSGEFLEYKSFKQTDIFRDICLLHELRLRKLDDIFENVSGKFIVGNKNKNIDSNALLFNFFAENQRINFFLKADTRKINASAFSSVNSLIMFFLNCLNNKTQVINKNHTETIKDIDREIYYNFLKYFDYEGFIKSIESRDDKDSMFLKLDYYFYLLSLDRDDTASYEELRSKFEEIIHKIKGLTKYNFISMLASICARHASGKEGKYLDDYFRYVEILLNEKLFLVNSSFLAFPIVKNIISFSINRKDYEYAEDFMNNYSQYFNPAYKDDYIKYYNALLLFSKGDFGKSLEHLSGMSLSNVILKKESRILKIKSYYELGFDDSVISEMDAFKHFLSNDKLLSRITNVNSANFIKFVSKLLKLNGEKSDVRYFKKELEEENEVYEKNWLLEKFTNRNKKSAN